MNMLNESLNEYFINDLSNIILEYITNDLDKYVMDLRTDEYMKHVKQYLYTTPNIKGNNPLLMSYLNYISGNSFYPSDDGRYIHDTKYIDNNDIKSYKCGAKQIKNALKNILEHKYNLIFGGGDNWGVVAYYYIED